MDSTLGSMPNAPTGRWLRRLLVCGAVMVISIILATVLYVRTEREVEQMLAEIRARGAPVTPAELETYYAVPLPAEDATPLWLAAIEEVRRAVQGNVDPYRRVPIVGAEETGPLVPPGTPWPEFELTARFLEESAPALEAVHKAVNFGGRIRFPGAIATVISMPSLDRMQGMRNAMRRLQLEAYVRAHRHDATGTADSLHAMLSLSRLAMDEPLFAPFITSITLDGIALNSLGQLLGNVEFTDAQLALLQRDLETFDLHQAYYRALCGERALGLCFFDLGINSARFVDFQMQAARVLRPVDEREFLRRANKMVVDAEKSWPELFRASDTTNPDVPSNHSPLHIITNLVSGPTAMLARPTTRCECAHRLITIAVALQRYRLRCGAPAAQLGDLVPDILAQIPTDPVNGAAYYYRAESDRYVLYCKNETFPLDDSSVWTLKTSTHPHLLFRWPPLVEPSTNSIDNPKSTGELEGAPVNAAVQ